MSIDVSNLQNNKMNTRLYPILTIFFSFLFSSCHYSEEERMLEHALALSGANRTELEKVLHHYADDSLKLEAAKYLIRNMPGHYSYADTAAIHRYALAVDSVLEYMQGETDYNIVRDSIDQAAYRMGIDRLTKVQDCQIMEADFLIRHIDGAFRDWRCGPWGRHVTFEDFCEWILPYKVEELQPLDDWREGLKTFCIRGLGELDCCDQLRNSPLAAAKVLNQNMADSLRPTTGLSVRHAHIPMAYRTRIPFAQCGDYARMATSVLRSHGIPVVMEFTPQWAGRSLGHAWNVLLSDDGREIAFGGISDRIGELHKMNERMPKVYRHTYACNRELVELNRSESFVPGVFRNIFIRDVTGETLQCSDVTLELDKEKCGRHKFAYLLVFDNHDWVPVAYGRIKRGRATFRDMGQHVVYLPAVYDNGLMKPVAAPFVLNYDGTTRTLAADTSRRQDMRLERKYPLMEYAYSYTPRLKDGEFHASNDATFRTYYTVHRIAEGRPSGQCVEVPDSIPPCRYWRYTNARVATFCSIGEVSLYVQGDTVRLQGRVIGTDGSWGNSAEHTKETVFDGNVLTSFDAPSGEGCWAGLDLGRPVKVDHLIYYGRCDGNSVEIGDEYELVYWHEGAWESLGRQTATHVNVHYKDVPAGGLYLLRDHTKGVDERIFTYEEGRVVWW